MMSKASVGLHLHPIGEFERLDARFQQRVLLGAARDVRVQLAEQIQLLALLSSRGVRIA